MQEQRENENWCMTAGMVSSGKSRFLNSIFPGLHLPVGSIPLTAAPTYIRYGKDTVRVIAKGNQIVESSLEKLAFYDRRWARTQSEPIELEVYLEEALLKEQLVFIDMPGIGGVEEKADRIFYQLLPQVQVVFYFLEKAMTLGDKKYLDEICRQGAKLIVVRTKIDNIYSSEESVGEVLGEEEKYIHSLYPECGLYFISLDDFELAENQMKQLKDFIFCSLADTAGKVKKDMQRRYQLKELRERQEKLREELRVTKVTETRMSGLARNGERRRQELDDQLRQAKTDIEKAADMAKKNWKSQGKDYFDEQFFQEDWTKGEESRLIEKALSDLSVWYRGYLEELTRKYLPGTDAEVFLNDSSFFDDYELPDDVAMVITGERRKYERLAAESFVRAKADLLRHFQKLRGNFQARFYDDMKAEENLIRQILRKDRQITEEKLKKELMTTEERLEAMRNEVYG